jgi:hypothetical protein
MKGVLRGSLQHLDGSRANIWFEKFTLTTLILERLVSTLTFTPFALALLSRFR